MFLVFILNKNNKLENISVQWNIFSYFWFNIFGYQSYDFILISIFDKMNLLLNWISTEFE